MDEIRKTLSLKFETGVVSDEARRHYLMPEAMIERLLSRGYYTININWTDIVTAEFFVEDDAMFLVEACNEVSEFRSEGDVHGVFLGDGLLEIQSVLSGNSVHIHYEYVPYLDKRFLEHFHAEMPLANYVSAWYRLINDLERAASGEVTEDGDQESAAPRS